MESEAAALLHALLSPADLRCLSSVSFVMAGMISGACAGGGEGVRVVASFWLSLSLSLSLSLTHSLSLSLALSLSLPHSPSPLMFFRHFFAAMCLQQRASGDYAAPDVAQPPRPNRR